MTPIEVRERLEALGAIDDADGPGVYALEVAVPDAVDAVQRRWLKTADVPLPDAYAEQLADATDTVLYVGRSAGVYDRLMDHARGDVRRALFLRAFDLAGVRGVYADDANTGVAERDRARALSDATTCVWTDGELF